MFPNEEYKLNVSKPTEILLNGALNVSILLNLLGLLRKVNEQNWPVPVVSFPQSTSLKLCQMLKDLMGGWSSVSGEAGKCKIWPAPFSLKNRGRKHSMVDAKITQYKPKYEAVRLKFQILSVRKRFLSESAHDTGSKVKRRNPESLHNTGPARWAGDELWPH